MCFFLRNTGNVAAAKGRADSITASAVLCPLSLSYAERVLGGWLQGPLDLCPSGCWLTQGGLPRSGVDWYGSLPACQGAKPLFSVCIYGDGMGVLNGVLPDPPLCKPHRVVEAALCCRSGNDIFLEHSVKLPQGVKNIGFVCAILYLNCFSLKFDIWPKMWFGSQKIVLLLLFVNGTCIQLLSCGTSWSSCM